VSQSCVPSLRGERAVAAETPFGLSVLEAGRFHGIGNVLRKINSNIGSVSVNAFSLVIQIVVVLSGLML
jgi:hypothetical protein